jgi:hypothetical protein
MKQNNVIFIFLVSVFMLLFSCKKNNTAPANVGTNSDLIEKVKNYLDLRQENYVDSGKFYVASIKQHILYENLSIEELVTGERIIIIPLQDSFKTRNYVPGKSFKNLIIIEDEKQHFRKADIVEIVPDNQNIKQLPANTISNAYNNKPVSTNGKISILTLHNRNICDLIYKSGKLKEYHVLEATKSGRKVLPYENNSPGFIQVNCTDWYWMYYIDGAFAFEVYAYTTCSGCDDMQSNFSGGNAFINCAGGGGNTTYNTGTYETIISVDSVWSDLTKPCFINVVNGITNSTIRNQIIKLFNETYVGTGNIAHVRFNEDNTLTNSDGTARAAKSHIDPIFHEWVITMNPSYGTNTSTEFWGSVIAHELIHSFMTISGTENLLTDSAQHLAMFKKWVNQISDFLQQTYGVSQFDANALALGGLDNALVEIGINSDATFKQKYNAFAQIIMV